MAERMTITEALAQIKLIQSKRTSLQKFILQYIVRDSRLKDPLDTTQQKIAESLQAISDLNKRLIKIRSAIHNANTTNIVEICGIKMPISEWLVWKREVAPFDESLYEQISHKIVQSRTNVPRSQLTQEHVDVEVGVDEEQLQELKLFRDEVFEKLDGQLSLKNATINIEF